MIQSSGRKGSGGGGGGSNRDVIFTAKIVTDPKNQQVLAGLSKQVDELQRKMSNIGVGGVGGRAGGVRGSGRPGVGGTSQLDKDFADLERKFASFERAERQRDAVREKAARDEQKRMREFKSNINDMAEGVVSLTRAMVLFGVSSEESLQKAVQKLALLEAGVQGFRGLQKIAGGFGGLLGVSGPAVGAGMAILAGGAVIGQGLREQYRGQAGPVSNATVSAMTSSLRWMYGDDEDKLSRMRPGMDQPYAHLAASQIKGERMFAKYASRTAGELGYNQGELGREQQRLAELLRMRSAMDALGMDAKSERERAALSYYGLDPRERKRALAARERFLQDPTKASEQDIFSAVSFLEKSQQARAREEFTRRAQGEGVYSQGWDKNISDSLLAATGKAIADIRLPEQREVVLKLTAENERLLEKWEQIMSRALEEVDEKNAKALQEISDRLMQQQRQVEAGRQQAQNAAANAYGPGF